VKFIHLLERIFIPRIMIFNAYYYKFCNEKKWKKGGKSGK
jgi:hypothetical protein